MSAYKTEIAVTCKKFVVDSKSVEIGEVVGAVNGVILHKEVFHKEIPVAVVLRFGKFKTYCAVFESLHLTIRSVDLSTAMADEKLSCEMSFNCTV